jgi:CobQ-like glutamine amidotransferase family enzyme
MTRPVRIAHLFPELLNLYGDGGNVIVLQKRCAWRGIDAEVVPVRYGERPSFAGIDLVLLGGGSDREQKIVCDELQAVGDELRSYVADGGVLLAVCGGYQLLGHSYVMGDEEVRGLSLVDLHTERGEPRLIGNVMIETALTADPVVGYENHGGRTYLGAGVEPLGRVVHGHGNNGADGREGCLWRNVVGTYVHGPLLPKNPGLADWLLARAVERAGLCPDGLAPLDDAAERAANAVMAGRMKRGEA